MRFNRKIFSILAFLVVGVMIAAISVVPALSLYMSEQAALAVPHARQTQAGTLSLTNEDIYIARQLKKQADPQGGYFEAEYDPRNMQAAAQSSVYDLRGLLTDARDAGILPEAWYESVLASLGSTFFVSTDSYGFWNYTAYSSREGEQGIYVVGLTVESQTNKIVGLFACADESENLPEPARNAVLASYVEYLGLRQAASWEAPGDTDFAENSLYSESAELLLSADTGEYEATPNYYFDTDRQTRMRSWFCVGARWLDPEEMRLYQSYTRSFKDGREGKLCGSAMRSVRWSRGWGWGVTCEENMIYEFAPVIDWVNEETGDAKGHHLILRIDCDTLTEEPVCHIEGCPHTDETCPAYVSDENVSLAAVGGMLYLLHDSSVRNEGDTAWIDVIYPNTGVRSRFCTFPSDWLIVLSGEVNNECWTNGETLYFRGYYGPEETHVSVAVDLKTAEMSVFDAGGGMAYNWGGQVAGPLRTGLLSLERTNPNTIVYHVAAARSEYWSTSLRPQGIVASLVWHDLSTGRRTLMEVLTSTEGQNIDRSILGTASDAIYWLEYTLDRSTPWKIIREDAFTGEGETLCTIDTTLGNVRMVPAAAEGQTDYIALGGDNGAIFLVDAATGERYPSFSYWRGDDGTYIAINFLTRLADGRWLVATDWLDDGRRCAYAVATTETLLAGEGEVQEIEMFS